MPAQLQTGTGNIQNSYMYYTNSRVSENASGKESPKLSQRQSFQTAAGSFTNPGNARPRTDYDRLNAKVPANKRWHPSLFEVAFDFESAIESWPKGVPTVMTDNGFVGLIFRLPSDFQVIRDGAIASGVSFSATASLADATHRPRLQLDRVRSGKTDEDGVAVLNRRQVQFLLDCGAITACKPSAKDEIKVIRRAVGSSTFVKLTEGKKTPTKGSKGVNGAKGSLSMQGHHNAGVATGKTIFVIDIDNANGESNVESLEDEVGKLPNTTVVKTKRGRHLYFRIPEGVELRTSPRDGFDFLGMGKYAVAPGSVVGGFKYHFVHGIEHLATLPTGWIDYLEQPVEAARTPKKLKVVSGNGMKDAELVEAIKSMSVGPGKRYETLPELCRTIMGAKGLIPLDEALKYVEVWHLASCYRGNWKETAGNFEDLHSKYQPAESPVESAFEEALKMEDPLWANHDFPVHRTNGNSAKANQNTRLLIRLALVMHKRHGKFFLSCETAGQLLNVSTRTAANYFKQLTKLNILKIEEEASFSSHNKNDCKAREFSFNQEFMPYPNLIPKQPSSSIGPSAPTVLSNQKVIDKSKLYEVFLVPSVQLCRLDVSGCLLGAVESGRGPPFRFKERESRIDAGLSQRAECRRTDSVHKADEDGSFSPIVRTMWQRKSGFFTGQT